MTAVSGLLALVRLLLFTEKQKQKIKKSKREGSFKKQNAFFVSPRQYPNFSPYQASL